MATEEANKLHSQSEKRWAHLPDVPVESMDYAYVEKCSDLQELKDIYEVLTSGKEGRYPDLGDIYGEAHAGNHASEAKSVSGSLKKMSPLLKTSKVQWTISQNGLRGWERMMCPG